MHRTCIAEVRLLARRSVGAVSWLHVFFGEVYAGVRATSFNSVKRTTMLGILALSLRARLISC